MAIPDRFDEERYRGFSLLHDEHLASMEEFAEQEDVPIIGPAMGRLLYVIARSVGAKAILELGTATGYSAIILGMATAHVGGTVETVEFDADMATAARKNIESADQSGRVTVIEGDAREVIEDLAGTYDMIFVDIEKEFYPGVLDRCVDLLKSGGILFFDNTSFKTAGDFLDLSFEHPDLVTVHQFGFFPGHGPENDSFTLCLKK